MIGIKTETKGSDFVRCIFELPLALWSKLKLVVKQIIELVMVVHDKDSTKFVV